MKQLLALKAEYKQATGQDYKPGAAPVQKAPTPVQNSPSPAPAATGIYERVAEQGEVVRKLKVEKASKVRLRQQIQSVLLMLSKSLYCRVVLRLLLLL